MWLMHAKARVVAQYEWREVGIDGQAVRIVEANWGFYA